MLESEIQRVTEIAHSQNLKTQTDTKLIDNILYFLFSPENPIINISQLNKYAREFSKQISPESQFEKMIIENGLVKIALSQYQFQNSHYISCFFYPCENIRKESKNKRIIKALDIQEYEKYIRRSRLRVC